MSRGVCRGCNGDGVIGTSCTSRACVEDGLHYLPAKDAEAFRATELARREPLVGTYVGKFLILKRLGRGGFGRVLLGLQRPLFKNHAAIKILSFETGDEAIRAVVSDKFVQEAETLSGLRHPNIVRFLDFEHEGPLPFLAMEFIPGGQTLTHALAARKGKPLPARLVQHLTDQILRALNVMHGAHLIHRDLKPDNIMLDRIDGDDWVVKLVDFGLAKDVAANPNTRYLAGTIAYMAPEQLIPGAPLGPSADLYALAIIAFELLTGRRLFDDLTHDQVRAAKRDRDYDPLAAHADLELSVETRAFFRIALATEPGQRYGSTESFGAGLRELTGGARLGPATDERGEADLTLLRPQPGSKQSLIAESTEHDRQTSTVARGRSGRRRTAAIIAGAAVAGAAVAVALAMSSGASEPQPVVKEAAANEPRAAERPSEIADPNAKPGAAAAPEAKATEPPRSVEPPKPVEPAPEKAAVTVVAPPPAMVRYHLETIPAGALAKVGDIASVTTPSDVSAPPGTQVIVSRAGCRQATYNLPADAKLLTAVTLGCDPPRARPAPPKADPTKPPPKEPNDPPPVELP